MSGVLGYAQGGQAQFGQSRAYRALPFDNYRSVSSWLEEWVDAIGNQFDIRYVRVGSAAARAALLDASHDSTKDVQDANIATPTTAPKNAASTDTMLDVLAFIALAQYPLDTNLTAAQRQALIAIGWDALRRKGTRLRLLALAAAISDGIAVGWTVPPYNFSIILPDGAPSPGYGSWVQATNALAETNRPWILNAIRNVLAPVTPSFVNLGVGYSQFRAGYSSAGETVFPSGARINILQHEHFDAWGAGVPTGWTKTGTGGTLTQSTSDTSINWEFTSNAAVLDLSTAANGVSLGLSQAVGTGGANPIGGINNQYTHRFQLDYKYTNAQNVSVLTVQITDNNADGNTYYYNNATSTWSTTAYTIAVPPSTARGRFAFDVVPQKATSSASALGTARITVAVSATSDGTATTKTTYTLYRVGLYEKFNLTTESAALGERTAWHPLIDSQGTTQFGRAGSFGIIAPANATRSSYRVVSATAAPFAYHPALSAMGYVSNSGIWTNLLKGSNAFSTDWGFNSFASATYNSVISPIIGETSPTATLVTGTSSSSNFSQQLGSTAASKTYVGGIWIRKISNDATLPSINIKLYSNVTIGTVTYTVPQANGWQLCPIKVTFGSSDVTAATFAVYFAAAGQIAVANAYLYDVTSNTGVLYPPVVQTAVGSTATLGVPTLKAVTNSTDTNVLHPLTQRTLQSVVRGAMGITIMPMFDASSQPNGVIFDLAQGAAQNRVCIRVNSGALELHRWDNSGNQWTASLTLTTNPSPASGSMTWARDTAITIRALWDDQQTTLSAGNGNAIGTKPGSWSASDASVATFRYGCDLAGANQFDGIVSEGEHVQLGAPVS